NTEYELEIKTQLDSGLISESAKFSFRTPQVDYNPIDKVDILSSHDVNSIQIQWLLKSEIDKSQVVGYDVYLNEDQDAPTHTWRRLYVENVEGNLAIPGLQSTTSYYVKIDVRMRDGRVVKSPTTYKFTTVDWRHLSHRPYPRTNPFLH
ncbi:unnamed protein product, partial [Mesorhabditis spiculigera]